MTLTKYVLYSTDNQPIDGEIYDTYIDAEDASRKRDEKTAVIEYEFEFSDSSLVDTRYDVWPPPLVEIVQPFKRPALHYFCDCEFGGNGILIAVGPKCQIHE